MSNKRVILYLLICTALGGLVWFDQTPTDKEQKPKKMVQLIEKPAAGITPISDTSISMVAAVSNVDIENDRWANPLAGGTVELLKNSVEQPLFSPTRQKPIPFKPKPRPVIVKKKPKPKPPLFELIGVVKTKDKSVALIRRKSNGLNFSVEAGDTIAGWKVSDVRKRSVRLKWTDGRNRTLEIFKD